MGTPLSAVSPPLDAEYKADEHAPADDNGAASALPKPRLHLETPFTPVLYILMQAMRTRPSKRAPSKTEIVLLRDPNDPKGEFSRALRKCEVFKKLRAAGIDWRILHNVCLLFRVLAVLEAREKLEREADLPKLRSALNHLEKGKKLAEPFVFSRLPFRIAMELDHVCEELRRQIASLKRRAGRPQQRLVHFFSATCARLPRIASGKRGRQYYGELAELAEFVFGQNRPGRYADVRTSSYKRELKYVERWARNQSRLLMIHPDGKTTVAGHI
jgi:hypothetical protein